MKKSLLTMVVLLSLSSSLIAAKSLEKPAGLYAQIATDMDGKPAPLAAYAGKVALVVNTASKCGLTGQYEGLQVLQGKYRDKGFVVLGFPSNDFMWQEPGNNREIKLFCEKNYKVDFPLFNKDKVKGEGKQPVYQFLTKGPQAEFHGEISWNFEKFLVGRDGKIVARFKPSVTPDDPELVSKIEAALSSSGSAQGSAPAKR